MAHPQLAASRQDLAALDRDRCIRQILGVESPFKFEILGQEDWTGRRMIADRFATGASSCAAMPLISGAVWRLRDERGNRRRHEFVLDVGGRNQGLG